MNKIIVGAYPPISQICHISVIVIIVTAGFNSQHISRGINSNVNTVDPHVGQCSSNNGNSGNIMQRGYKPPTSDGDVHNLNNNVIMQHSHGKFSNMYNDYAYNDVPQNIPQSNKPNSNKPNRHV